MQLSKASKLWFASLLSPQFGMRVISRTALSQVLAILGMLFLFPFFFPVLKKTQQNQSRSISEILRCFQGKEKWLVILPRKGAITLYGVWWQESQSNLYFEQHLFARQQDSYPSYKINIAVRMKFPGDGMHVWVSPGGRSANHRDILSAACGHLFQLCCLSSYIKPHKWIKGTTSLCRCKEHV